VRDAERKTWRPDLGTPAAGLRRIDRSEVADLLADAVRAGATSSEILSDIGIVLYDHRSLYSQISKSAATGWDAVRADVSCAYPGGRVAPWFTRLRRHFASLTQTT
jgi:hypothetical protein